MASEAERRQQPSAHMYELGYQPPRTTLAENPSTQPGVQSRGLVRSQVWACLLALLTVHCGRHTDQVKPRARPSRISHIPFLMVVTAWKDQTGTAIRYGAWPLVELKGWRSLEDQPVSNPARDGLDPIALIRDVDVEGYSFGEPVGRFQVVRSGLMPNGCDVPVPTGILEPMPGSLPISFKGKQKTFLAIAAGPKQHPYHSNISPADRDSLQQRIETILRQQMKIPRRFESSYPEWWWLNLGSQGRQCVLGTFIFQDQDFESRRPSHFHNVLFEVLPDHSLKMLWHIGGKGGYFGNYALIDALDLDGDGTPELILRYTAGGTVTQHCILRIREDIAKLVYEGPDNGC